MADTLEQITSFKGKYKFLSNFSHSPFTFDSLVYPTVEHFFQASKAYLAFDKDKIRNARTPRHAKFLGRNVELVDNWEEIKNDVMLTGLRYKFNHTRRTLPLLLLATGEAELIEGNTWNDRYWGCSPIADAEGNITWQGENNLGKLLMQVRDEISNRG